MKRIGILTGGGDAPGLNAAIRAVVKTSLGIYDNQVFGIRNGFQPGQSLCYCGGTGRGTGGEGPFG